MYETRTIGEYRREGKQIYFVREKKKGENLVIWEGRVREGRECWK
jgi:hypothetical protein